MLADPLFWKALGNTLYITVIGVPLAVMTALAIALLLNVKKIVGIGVFRTIFYLPVVVPPVASALLWIWLLNPQYGLVNQALGAVGLPHPQWFYDPAWAKAGIILIAIWGVGDVVIIYLGALQGVSQQLYEAAEVDGAGRWAKVRHVTIPMISPAILFNLITGAIGAFQYFTQAYVISEGTVGRGSGAVGGQNGRSCSTGIELYNEAFRYFDMGYASALAWVLLIVILITTAIMLLGLAQPGLLRGRAYDRRRRSAQCAGCRAATPCPRSPSTSPSWPSPSCSSRRSCGWSRRRSRPGPTAISVPPVWVPDPVVWNNFPDALAKINFRVALRNTLIYALPVGRRDGRVVQRRRLRVRPAQLARPRHRVHRPARDDDAADARSRSSRST